MKIYLILIVIAVCFVGFIGYFLYWAIFKGQYEDIEAKSDMILRDDDSVHGMEQALKQHTMEAEQSGAQTTDAEFDSDESRRTL